MDFHQLRYFLEVARLEHMGKAAKTLALSQSALSHSISLLEESLGTSLFRREGRRISLNDTGRLLLERGAKLLHEKNVLEDEIRSRSGELHGHLRIAAPVAINSFFVAKLWADFSRRHPKISGEISSMRTLDILSKVQSSQIDLGICFGPQAHPLMTTHSIAQRRLLFAVRKGIKKPKNLQSAINLLNSIPAALPNGLLGFGYGESHPLFKRMGLQANVSLLCDHYEVAIAAILQQDIWCLLPDWIVDHHSGIVQAVVPEKLFEELEITCVHSKNRPASPSLELFIGRMTQMIK